ncbi:MAG: hypothetical protein R3F61_00125 [Myxococcota bacterium]
MIVLALLQSALACPADPADVALRAQRSLDDPASANLAALVADTQCLNGWMTPEGAVALHRLVAMRAWEEHDMATVAAHLRSTPNDGWEPADAGLAKVAQVSRGTEARNTEAIAVPPGWRAVVDGRPTALRPLDRAVVFQWVDPEGVTRRTALLEPMDTVPTPPVAAITDMAPPPKVRSWAEEPENALLLGGIATVVAGGSVFAAGLATRGNLPEPKGGGPDPMLVGEVRDRARRANALGYAGQGIGLVGVGLIVTSRVAF